MCPVVHRIDTPIISRTVVVLFSEYGTSKDHAITYWVIPYQFLPVIHVFPRQNYLLSFVLKAICSLQLFDFGKVRQRQARLESPFATPSFRKIANLHTLFLFELNESPNRTVVENNQKNNIPEPICNPTRRYLFLIASTYSCSSFAGFVSSNRRLTGALYFCPRPKLIAIALVCPICK